MKVKVSDEGEKVERNNDKKPVLLPRTMKIP